MVEFTPQLEGSLDAEKSKEGHIVTVLYSVGWPTPYIYLVNIFVYLLYDLVQFCRLGQ